MTDDLRFTLEATPAMGLSLSTLSLSISRVALPPYRPESLAVFAAMTTPPDPIRKVLIDATIRELIAAGLWTTIDLLYVLAAHDEQAARVNWKTPASVASAVSSPTFTEDRGFQGNGSTSYLNTGVTLSSLGHYSQNNASKWVWSRSSLSEVAAAIGTLSSTDSFIRPFNSTVMSTRGNDATTSSTANGDGSGFFGWSRDAANHYDQFKNAAILNSPAVASTGVPAGNVTILRSASGFSTRQIAAGGAGGALTADGIAALHSILLTYLQAVGAA